MSNSENLPEPASSRRRAFFITGTDTDVGKTTIACALLAEARRRGLSTAAMKPIASGCIRTDAGLRNDDAVQLWQQCTIALDYAALNPIAIEPPIAPHIGAEEAGCTLTVAMLQPVIESVLAKAADITCIEGAGGWQLPLNAHEYLPMLIRGLRLPVVLVAGLRLGGINHALLTAQSVRAEGLPLAAWVGNVLDPEMPRLRENIQTLARALECPCLGIVPRLPIVQPETVARYLNFTPLLNVGFSP